MGTYSNNQLYPSNYIINGTSHSLIWEGKRLKQFGTSIYEYDENGIRISNKRGSLGLTYVVEGNKIVRSTNVNGSSIVIIDYNYDEKGLVCGLSYNGQEYFYVRDLTGNINKIIDKDGIAIVEYKYTAYGVPSKEVCSGLIGEKLTIANIIKDNNIYIYKGYCYDVEIGLYYNVTRYYDPKIGRFISADDISYLDPKSIGGLNLYAYCLNNPIMNFDPTGKFAISLTLLGLIVGAVIGATAGGVVAYNVAKNNGAEGWELFGWTMAGIVGGGIVGGALGAGAAALVTKATGITGLSITKYSIIPIKSVTVLGNIPTYSSAAIATGSGYYQISTQLYNNLSSADRLANNLQYLADANSLGSQFAIIPEYVIKSGYTLWEELNYLIQNGIPYIIH